MTVAAARSIMAERTYVDDMRFVYNKGTDDEDTMEADDEQRMRTRKRPRTRISR